jgi:hypothetical protein
MSTLVPARRFPNGQFAPRQWKPVESSNLEAVTFVRTHDDCGRLYVAFKGDTIYRYEDVDEADFETIVEAGNTKDESAGHVLWELVKEAGNPYEQLA